MSNPTAIKSKRRIERNETSARERKRSSREITDILRPSDTLSIYGFRNVARGISRISVIAAINKSPLAAITRRNNEFKYAFPLIRWNFRRTLSQSCLVLHRIAYATTFELIIPKAEVLSIRLPSVM